MYIYAGLHGAEQKLENAWRRSIETLFGIFKSRGVRLEDTHISAPERLSKLLAPLTLVLCWCVLTGQMLAQRKPLKIKKHGRLEQSLFRDGFDHLRSNLALIASNISSYVPII
jgi:hypothetical protein